MRLLAWTALCGALFIGLFTVLASYAFLYSTGLIAYFPDPHHQWYQWWVYLGERSNPAVNAGLWWWSGIPAATFPLVVFGAVAYTRRWSLRKDIRPALRRVPPPDRLPVPTIPGATRNHGAADFAKDEEMIDRWPKPPPGVPALIVGEMFDPCKRAGPYKPRVQATWGLGGMARLLYDDLRSASPHTVRIGGSGSGKTESLKCSLRTSWTGGVVVLDPKQTLGRQLKAAREAMGHRVIVVTPEDAKNCGTNVLDGIDPASPLADIQIDDVVESVCGSTPRSASDSSQFFTDSAKDVVRCLLSHIIADPTCPPEVKRLRTMRTMLASPVAIFQEYLQAIHQNSPSNRAKDLAGSLLDNAASLQQDPNASAVEEEANDGTAELIVPADDDAVAAVIEDSGDENVVEEQPPVAPVANVDKTLRDILRTANQLTSWLSTEVWSDLVCGDSFQTTDILDGKTDIFLSLPFQSLTSEPAPARCLLFALFNTLFQRIDPARPLILFALDEVAELKAFGPLETAWNVGRECGIALHLMYQARRQITDQWGPGGLSKLDESASWISYVNIKNYETAKEISAGIGTYPAVAVSESVNTGFQGRGIGFKNRSRGVTHTYSEIGIPRIRPEEIMGLPEDAQIVTGGRKPGLFSLPLDYRRKAREQQQQHHRMAPANARSPLRAHARSGTATAAGS